MAHNITSMAAASSFESTMRTEITSMGLYFLHHAAPPLFHAEVFGRAPFDICGAADVSASFVVLAWLKLKHIHDVLSFQLMNEVK